jgi:cytochrome c peroxidase
MPRSPRTLRRALVLVAGAASLAAAAIGRPEPAAAGASAPGSVPLVELGRRLFFDPAVSRSGRSACASCHDPAFGYSDPAPRSADDFGPTLRHSQTLLDAARNPSAHWDGEFESLDELITARLGVPSGRARGYGTATPRVALPPVADHELDDVLARFVRAVQDGELRVSHGALPRTFDVTRLERVDRRVEEGGRYDEAFVAAFGSHQVTIARLSEALAAYVHSIESTEAPFDRWRRGERDAIDASAQRGFALFRGRAGCAQCHTARGRHPLFTDYEFHDTGVAWKASGGGETPDPGRELISTSPSHRRAFKTPTLRDVARTAPYMHDASIATLEEVVRHYAGGGSKDPDQDRRIRPFRADPQDVADLVAFLHTLTGEVRPGLPAHTWRARAETTALQFVGDSGAPLAGMRVSVVPSGDTLPGDVPGAAVTLDLVTDADGRVRFTPPARTHVRLVLPPGFEPTGGDLVPDTCSDARVVVPVTDRTHVVVTCARDLRLPGSIVLEHQGDMVVPRPMTPRSTFERVSEVVIGDRRVARYGGWLRSDASRRAFVQVSGRVHPSDMPLVELSSKVDARIDLDETADAPEVRARR